jgi:hypothetical protein
VCNIENKKQKNKKNFFKNQKNMFSFLIALKSLLTLKSGLLDWFLNDGSVRVVPVNWIEDVS